MPSFEMQFCVGNYQTTTDTNFVANNPTICENKDHYYFCSNNKLTLFSQKNNAKSNEVT